MLAGTLSSPAFAAAPAQPAPTPGCVFTGGAYTCGGAVPPDVEMAPTDPGPAPSDPAPSDPGPAEPEPGASTGPAPSSDPAESPGVPAQDGDGSEAQGVPLWVPLTIGGVAIAAVVAGTAYAVMRRRGGDPSA